MNTFATTPATLGGLSFVDIIVDGRPLSHHFSGAQGNHPSQISPLGWSSASAAHRVHTVAQLLGKKPSLLASGRVPVLVCEDCGDVVCGALAVRIVRGPDQVIWTDWMFENGYEAGRPLTWVMHPGELAFDGSAYEAAVRNGL